MTSSVDRVSDAAGKALRAAMERLLAGRPTCTDGRLIKENLYREAGVSRATMNRAHGILAEWDRRTASTDARTPGEALRDDKLRQLEGELKRIKQDRTALQRRLDAAATVITALHHENLALQQTLTAGGQVAQMWSLDRRTRGGAARECTDDRTE